MLLSVIIPTRNRSHLLAGLLDSMARLNPANFEWEVLVIDNGSTDDTAMVARQKIAELPVTIRYFFEAQPGLHNGRHRGAREARGDYLGYLDDDMLLEPTWLSGVELLVQGYAQAVVGPILPKWLDEPPAWIQLMLHHGVLGTLGLLNLGPDFREVPHHRIYGGNCFIPKTLVFDLGGFHPDGMPPELIQYRGDGETGFFQKFHDKCNQGWYDPRAIAYHIIGPERMTVDYFCQRMFNQGISDSFARLRSEQVLSDKDSCKKIQKGQLRHDKMIIPEVFWTQVKNKLTRSHEEGVLFHQNKVFNDDRLLEWIKKDKFLNQ